jgi:Calcium-binding EGF domain
VGISSNFHQMSRVQSVPCLRLFIELFCSVFSASHSSCRSHHEEIICECPEDMDLDDDMKTCINVDPCHVIPNGGCSHFCDSSLTEMCYCPPGFALEDDGRVCREEFKCGDGFTASPHDTSACIDIDECAVQANVCLNGRCENREGTFVCHCNAGYESSDSNKACVDVDECSREASPCSHRCLNLPGSYQCDCPYGQVLIEDGHTCGFSDLCDFNNGGCGMHN